MSKTLILTVGLPRSGKSTWARAYSKANGIPLVSADEVRMSFYGHPFIRKGEIWIWPFVRVMVESLFRSGHDTVIMDSTCTVKKDRDWWKDDMWEIKFKRLQTPPEVCIARAAHSEKIGEAFAGLVEMVHKKIQTLEELDYKERMQELHE